MFNHNADDPRVKKTRQGLRDALIRLILVKGYDAILIQDIAQAAQTARITFYRHYPDKEALLTDCLNTLFEQLVKKTEQLSPQAILDGYSPVQILYDHIVEQENLYRVLFSSRGTQIVIEQMRHHLAAHAIKNMRASGRTPHQNVPIEIIAYHTASAQIGLAMWWLDQGKPFPAVYMARISLWLTLTGLLGTFGVTDFKPPPPSLDATP
jgi:AcrR family transcriptional regulator